MLVKKIDNATLVVVLIIMGLMLFGIITAESEDVILRGRSATERSSPAVPLDRYAFTPSAPAADGIGGSLPYIMAGGGAPVQYADVLVGTMAPPAPQARVPGEGVWLGMEIEGLSPGTIRELRLPQNITGVIVDSAPPGSIAEKAGLRNGDIIKAINGRPVVNMADYIKATGNQKLKSATLRVERNGQVMDLQVPQGTVAGAGLAGRQSWTQRYPTGPGIDTYTYASPTLTHPFTHKPIPPISVNSPMPHAFRGVCAKCHRIVPGSSLPYPPVYSRVGQAGRGNSALPTPAQQRASRKVLVEGHWLGMELIPITPELARMYNLPAGVSGLLVDEVTLEAAESGLLAGDVLQSINNIPVANLRDFELATRKVELLPTATLGVLRNRRRATITLRSRWGRLGASQNEAAQPIQPGAISPHQNMGRACTDCHIIMKNGGQLQKDAGDILPTPPPVTLNSQAPHSYRGQCNNCHPIVR
ncbi:MAG: hypothetical protein FVQ81_05025 [Candidatus Glassbacteria bacterium]|nr:hypothetical protein [Candidatus Glassbacteria bacterium]